jgi:hypothetical protein
MTKAALTIASIGLSATVAFAQKPTASDASTPSTRKQIIDEMVVAGVAAARTKVVPRPFQTRLGPGGRGEIVAYLIAAHTEREGNTV